MTESDNSNISLDYVSVLTPPKHTSSPIKGKHQKDQQSTIKIMIMNAQSIKNKAALFQTEIEGDEKPDVIVVTETWLKPDISNSEYMPNNSNFSVYRKDRPGKTVGGGVLIAVRNSLVSECVDELDSDCEIVWVKLKLIDSKDLYVGAFYRPPSNKETDLCELEKSIKRLQSTNSIVCLCGDFNLPGISWETDSAITGSKNIDLSNKLLEIKDDAGLTQMIDTPTRGNNILDLYFTTNPTLARQVKVIPGIADHGTIVVDSLLKPVANVTPVRKVYQFHKGNLDALNHDITSFGKDFLQDCGTKSVNELWICFHSMMVALQDKYIPTKVVKPCSGLPWVTKEIKRLLRKKNRLYKRGKILQEPETWAKFRHIKSMVQRKIRQARWDHVNDIVNQEGDKARKGFWRYVKQLKKDNTAIAVLKKEDVTATTPIEKAELLNNQFSSVFTDEDADFVPQLDTDKVTDIGEIHITVPGVEKLLNSLNTNKATGPDGLSGRLLKETAKSTAPLIRAIFQRSLETGSLPEVWKTATVSPIYKKGSRSDPANYRPVSLTCILCKTMEHIINRHLLNHMEQFNLLADAQHGFRKRRSCETQLLLTYHDIAKTVNKSGQVDMLVLDFAKAFDTVAHKRLLGKLESYGVHGALHSWIQSFLEGRTQMVVVDGASSNSAIVKSGVPQGSVLGPLLFLIYINDLAKQTDATVRLFADDCVMYSSIKNTTDCEGLQHDLDLLHQWEKRWLLKFNVKKCNVLRATHAKTREVAFDYNIGGTPLEITKSTTYLGVELSKDLKWNSHVDKTRAKGTQMLGVLRRNLKFCPQEIKDKAYKVYVRPTMEYASPIWDPYTADNIKKIESVQRKASRFVCNKFGRDVSVTQLLRQLQWPLMEQRRAEARLSTFHRMIYGTIDINWEPLMTRNERVSRSGHTHRFMRHSTRKDCYKFSFIPRSIVQWNNLANDDIVEDLPQFKLNLQTYDLTLAGATSYKI